MKKHILNKYSQQLLLQNDNIKKDFYIGSTADTRSKEDSDIDEFMCVEATKYTFSVEDSDTDEFIC